MTLRTKDGQALHDSFVASVMSVLGGRGISKIYADLPNFAKPATINGHIPDIIAYWPDGRMLIVEVETRETADTIHTRFQHSAFAAYALQNQNVRFENILAE